MIKSPYISNLTGQPIDNDEQLRQKIIDVLTTPIGTRLMRRDYGCGMIDALDMPVTTSTLALAKARIAKALKAFVKNFATLKITITQAIDNFRYAISIIGFRTDVSTQNPFVVSFGV